MWIIEFRSGTYFQHLDAMNGGPAHTAQTFPSQSATEDFMALHEWILMNGGMPVEISTLLSK